MKIVHRGIITKSAGRLILLLSLSVFTVTGHAADPAMPIEGRLTVAGSVALSNLVTYWTQAFAQRNPLVTVTVAAPGGVAGIDALINGISYIALISTPISEQQKDAFTARFGYPPQIIPVAMDAVAVYVNDLNPITRISLRELDAVFSITYRCGDWKPVRTWGGLGVKGTLARHKVSIYGLTANTGAYSLFKETALCGGDFNRAFQALAGPAAVENALQSDIYGIGFSSSAMRTAGIHALAIARQKGKQAVAPTAGAIRSGRYPLGRTLSIAVNRPPNQPLSPELQAFIDFVLSPEGQEIAAKAGYVTLP